MKGEIITLPTLTKWLGCTAKKYSVTLVNKKSLCHSYQLKTHITLDGSIMYQGSCLCGAIRVELVGVITDIIHCHCSLCRKNSGTAYATNGFINTSEFKVVDPQNKLGFYEMKPGKKRHFCTVCASPIFSSNADNPSKLRIRLGILDSAITERPLSHNFVSSKACWDDLDAQLPRYDGHEPSRAQAK